MAAILEALIRRMLRIIADIIESGRLIVGLIKWL